MSYRGPMTLVAADGIEHQAEGSLEIIPSTGRWTWQGEFQGRMSLNALSQEAVIVRLPSGSEGRAHVKGLLICDVDNRCEGRLEGVGAPPAGL